MRHVSYKDQGSPRAVVIEKQEPVHDDLFENI